MARGRISNLRKSSRKAFNKVAGARGSMKCGRSPRGAKKEVCLAVAPMPGWSCGLNRVNGLYACVNSGGRRKSRGRRVGPSRRAQRAFMKAKSRR
jgi:hypothetical protein